MPGINKHLEKADKYLQKGKLEQALEELLVARKEEPNEDSIVLSVADVYQRLNRAKDCRQCYAFLFDKYCERDDSQKALELFSKLKALGTVEPKRLVALAQLLDKHKPKEAAEYYKQAAEAAGADHETALAAMEGLAGLEPPSVETNQRIAALASKLGRNTLAASAYTRVGDLLVAQKKFPEACDALEQAYRLSGESAPARIALAKACSIARRFSRVLELLGTDESQGQKQSPDGSKDPQTLSLLAEAYYAENDWPKAEAVYWQLAEHSAEAFLPLTNIVVDYLDQQNYSLALPMLKRLEQEMTRGKNQRELMALAQRMSRLDLHDVAVLEFLTHLADVVHLDAPLAKSLHSLFDIYFEAGEIDKCTDALERLIDVDIYAPECTTKLKQLEGKAEPAAWRELASRLGYSSTASKPGRSVGADSNTPAVSQERGQDDDYEADQDTTREEGSGSGGEGALGDLILQAEIFLQYNLQDKARERLERISKLFPGEEEKNEELRGLFERAGFNPRAQAPAAAPAAPRAAAAPAKLVPSRSTDLQADWSGISEVIRNLSRQSTVKGVLSAAVNGIGRLWKSSRCVVGLATPKQPPTVALEYIAPGVKASDALLLGKLVMGLQQLTEERAASVVSDKVSGDKLLKPLKGLLDGLQVESLIAVPLREDNQGAGILILEQCGSARSWQPNEVTGLETIADQIVFATSNARLRNLVRTLAVKDESSGLLHRDSYLSCLLSETERLRSQKTPLAVAILDFSGTAAGSPDQAGKPDAALGDFMRQFPITFASHLRQNDIPVKYGARSLAVILPATTAEQALFMVEKMRKLSASFSASVSGGARPMAAGIAQSVPDAEMDSADIVTELINRVEDALVEARTIGANATKVRNVPSPQNLPQ